METTSGTTVAGVGALGCDPATHVSENQACVAPTWGISYPATTCSAWEVGCVSPSQLRLTMVVLRALGGLS